MSNKEAMYKYDTKFENTFFGNSGYTWVNNSYFPTKIKKWPRSCYHLGNLFSVKRLKLTFNNFKPIWKSFYRE